MKDMKQDGKVIFIQYLEKLKLIKDKFINLNKSKKIKAKSIINKTMPLKTQIGFSAIHNIEADMRNTNIYTKFSNKILIE